MYFQIVHCYSIARVKLLDNLYEIDKEEKNEMNIKCILCSCKHYFVKILMSNSDFFFATKEWFCQEKQQVWEREKDGGIM